MDRVRAALLGCLLTGGVIFGARPVLPDRRLREVPRVAGPGGNPTTTPADRARWFSPVPPRATLASLRPTATLRRRCNAGRVRRHPW